MGCKAKRLILDLDPRTAVALAIAAGRMNLTPQQAAAAAILRLCEIEAPVVPRRRARAEKKAAAPPKADPLPPEPDPVVSAPPPPPEAPKSRVEQIEVD